MTDPGEGGVRSFISYNKGMWSSRGYGFWANFAWKWKLGMDFTEVGNWILEIIKVVWKWVQI